MPLSRAQKRQNQSPSPSIYDDLLCFNFYKGWRVIQEFYAEAFPRNVNPQRLYVIGLCVSEPATVSKIATVLSIDDAAVSNILRRMEKDKLITRTRSISDRRSLQVKATEYGIKVANETEQKLLALDKRLHSQISGQDVRFLSRIVRVMQSNIIESA